MISMPVKHYSRKMVDERRLDLLEIFNEKQIHHVLGQLIERNVPWKLEASEVKPAADGIAGFLGEHMKVVLNINAGGENKKVHLFVKRIPAYNKEKAKFIGEKYLFEREQLMLKILEEICTNSSNPWCVKAYLYTNSMIVMPDLSIEGYQSRSYLHTLDYQHASLSTTAIASFHAAIVNYETKKSVDLKRPYSITQEFGYMFIETLSESNWFKTCSKLSVNLLKAFSTKGYGALPDLESKFDKLFAEACETLTEYKDTVNVLLHRDLWVNNIMFKYEKDVPKHAVLIDYQLLRYGPPAFDMMIFLYCTTDRTFREERQKDILDHYYSVFIDNLNDDSVKRLKDLAYDKGNFLEWCEKGRMFGMFVTIATHPFVLMDPKTAQKVFDDPETFDKHIFGDRSEPVLAYADRNEIYKLRNVSVIEEFVERYVLE